MTAAASAFPMTDEDMLLPGAGKNDAPKKERRVEGASNLISPLERQTEREPVGTQKYALDDDHDEWQDRPHQRDEDATLADDDEDHRNVPQYTRRLPSQHLGAAGLVTEKQVHANRSGDPLGHGAVSKARVRELKNMQDHNVFEVVWLESVIDRTYAVAARREGEVVKASFVAQQVACDSRDHVFAGTPLVVAREPKHRRDQAHGLFDIISCRELSVDEFSGADPSNWHLCPQDSDYFCEEAWTERARHQHFRL